MGKRFAKTNDYASRFRLVVSANPNCEDAIGDNAPLVVSSGVAGEAACEPNATFAYAGNDDCPCLS